MTMVINRQQALERLISLESEAVNLRKILDHSVLPNSLLPYPTKDSDKQTYYISESENGKFYISSAQGNALALDHGNVFVDRADADAYKEAINTFLLLRKQEGSTPTRDKVAQWLLEYDVEGNKVVVARRYVLGSKMSRLSPSFASDEHANKAIKSIGKDKLIEMFKTFHHVN